MCKTRLVFILLCVSTGCHTSEVYQSLISISLLMTGSTRMETGQTGEAQLLHLICPGDFGCLLMTISQDCRPTGSTISIMDVLLF